MKLKGHLKSLEDVTLLSMFLFDQSVTVDQIVIPNELLPENVLSIV